MNLKRIFCYSVAIVFFTLLLYSAFRGIKYASSLTDKETKDRITYQIGDVTIGTDSITALRRISQRLMSIKGDVNTIVYEDSIGYYFPAYNESYYVTIDNGYVTRIYFHSDSLTMSEIRTIARNNRYCKHRLIYFNNKTWTAYQDGKGSYIIYKN